MGKVYRKQRIEGVTVPAVIHNGQYFWLNMAVYEDGTVSCWNKVDLSDVPRQLSRGWLTTYVPEGAILSVFELCSLKIAKARWSFDNDSYYEFIQETVRSINPEMENIYKTTPREREKWEKYRVRFSANPTPCKLKGGFGYDLLDGMNVHILLRNEGKLLLTEMDIYADGTFSIDAFGERVFILSEIEQMFSEGTLCTSPNGGETVSFGALGEAECVAVTSAKPAEKLKEIKNRSLEIQKIPDAHDKCIMAYHEYLTSPTNYNKEKLREAYEAVPEHERIYLGDMDTRNTDFERILYTDEKREV